MSSLSFDYVSHIRQRSVWHDIKNNGPEGWRQNKDTYCQTEEMGEDLFERTGGEVRPNQPSGNTKIEWDIGKSITYSLLRLESWIDGGRMSVKFQIEFTAKTDLQKGLGGSEPVHKDETRWWTTQNDIVNEGVNIYKWTDREGDLL